MKFKIGDKVKIIDTNTTNFWESDVGTIKRIAETIDGITQFLVDFGYADMFFEEKELVLFKKAKPFNKADMIL